jgi:hypothetical protein
LKSDGPARNFYGGDVSLDSAYAQVRRLRVPGRLAGRIKDIGPLHCDIIAKTQMSSEWKSIIRNNISDSRLKSIVLEQSDLFLEVLERFDEISQGTIFTFDRKIGWTEVQQISIQTLTLKYGSELGMITSPSVGSSLSGCRLFLLQPPALEHTASWMGIAPQGTQVADFVCHIPGIERAIIVRQSENINTGQFTPMYEIIGCAGLARGRDTARQVMRRATRLPSELFASGNPSAPAEAEQFNLYMDIHTAYEISC